MTAEVRGARRPVRLARWGAIVAAVAVLVGSFTAPISVAADTSPRSGTPETVSADALPTVQIDGVVYAQEVVGNTVYVGGSFTKARPAGAAPGTNETPRANLLAYDLTTGNLISSWNPGTNNTVLDIKKSADGSRIYVAGMFSQAAGAWRYRVAAFDTATGALITNWAPEVNGRVDSVAVADSSIYLAGEFTTVNSAQRTKVAAVTASSGAVTGFSADVQGGYGAKSVVVSPDRSQVVIAGSFTSVNGSTNPGRGIAALDAATGSIRPWAMNSVLRNAGATAAGYGVMYSLASDGDSVYGTGAAHGRQADGGAFEGSFRADWNGGRLIWMEDCHGDTYDIAPAGDTVYVAGHPHYCGNIGGFPEVAGAFHHSLAFSAAPNGKLITKDTVGGAYGSYEGQPTASLLPWYPDYTAGTHTGQGQGPWQITAAGDYLLVGGEFVKVNGAAQQGIVRFAKKSIAPGKQGPRIQGGSWKLAATASATGNTLTWNANHDRDNESLTYRVFRQDRGMTTPLHEVTQSSNFWTLPALSFTDRTVVAGATYKYRITVTDPSGNSTQTDWVAVTTAADVAAPTPAGPAPQPAAVLARDSFTRTAPAGGWGSADLGGAWTPYGGSAAYSVTGDRGAVALTPASTRAARLGLSGTDAVIRVSIAADQVATGGAATATVIGRQVGSSNYSARVRFEVGGGVRLYLLRDETALGSYLMPGVTYTPGTVLNVALSVTGTNPTTLSAKVWKATDVEPATWQVTATDTTAAMQAAGTVGLMNTVSGASTLPSTVFTWDDLTITDR